MIGDIPIGSPELCKIFYGDLNDSKIKNKIYPNNRINTTKYTLINFLPKSLLLQFNKVANIYFLIVTILTFGAFSPINPASMIGTFIFVLICTMIKEAFDKEENINDKVDFNTMVMLAIATSIDALAIGITYAFLDARNIMFSFVLIGVITFIISLIGVKIGNKFGDKYGKKAELIGGLILVFIGIKILLEHIVLN